MEKEKTEKRRRKEPEFSRRDFNRIAATFGVTSTLLAFKGLAQAGERPSATQLAQAAKKTEKERAKTTPKFTLRYGAAGHDVETTWVAKIGTIDFTYELEERTDGAIRVEHLGSNSICGEMACAEKCTQGIIDLYVASTQNSSTICPYMLNLDWGALWPSRAAMYSFADDPRSEDLFREPIRRLYGLEMLHTDGAIRPLLQVIGEVDGPDLGDPGGLDVVTRRPVSERELRRGLCPLFLRLLGRLGQLCGAGSLPGLGQALEGQQGGGHTKGCRNAVEVPSRELWLLSSSFFSLFLIHVFPPFGD